MFIYLRECDVSTLYSSFFLSITFKFQVEEILDVKSVALGTPLNNK